MSMGILHTNKSHLHSRTFRRIRNYFLTKFFLPAVALGFLLGGCVQKKEFPVIPREKMEELLSNEKQKLLIISKKPVDATHLGGQGITSESAQSVIKEYLSRGLYRLRGQCITSEEQPTVFEENGKRYLRAGIREYPPDFIENASFVGEPSENVTLLVELKKDAGREIAKTRMGQFDSKGHRKKIPNPPPKPECKGTGNDVECTIPEDLVRYNLAVYGARDCVLVGSEVDLVAMISQLPIKEPVKSQEIVKDPDPLVITKEEKNALDNYLRLTADPVGARYCITLKDKVALVLEEDTVYIKAGNKRYPLDDVTSTRLAKSVSSNDSENNLFIEFTEKDEPKKECMFVGKETSLPWLKTQIDNGSQAFKDLEKLRHKIERICNMVFGILTFIAVLIVLFRKFLMKKLYAKDTEAEREQEQKARLQTAHIPVLKESRVRNVRSGVTMSEEEKKFLEKFGELKKWIEYDDFGMKVVLKDEKYKEELSKARYEAVKAGREFRKATQERFFKYLGEFERIVMETGSALEGPLKLDPNEKIDPEIMEQLEKEVREIIAGSHNSTSSAEAERYFDLYFLIQSEIANLYPVYLQEIQKKFYDKLTQSRVRHNVTDMRDIEEGREPEGYL